MWLLSVTPISRGISKEQLYYFSPEKLSEGDFIEVPLRSKNIVARVNSIRTVAETKSELKNLPFAIRKVSTLKMPKFFSLAFMAAAGDSALFFGSTLGAILYSLLPPKNLLSAIGGVFDEKTIPDKDKNSTEFVIQCQDEERIATYKRMIREQFAKKRSVFLIVPTIVEAKRIYREINKGIEEFSFLIHQRLPKKTVKENWEKATIKNHPVLLVSTSPFLGLPRNDVGIIVVERESSEFYKKEERPFIDYRVFARFLGKKLGANVVYGDSLVRSETFYKLDSGYYYEYGKNSFRFTSPAKTEIIAIERDKFWENKSTLSASFLSLIDENREKGGIFFILSPRRGLASRTICRSCGKSLSCPNCGGTLVLHGERRNSAEESAKYVCHRCGTETSSSIRCDNCNGWDLVPFGVGSERIEKEIKEYNSDIKVLRLDRDVAKNDATAEKIAKQAFSSPGSVLIGTEFALSYLNQKLEMTAIVFPELLTTIPEYSADEDALRTILRVKSLATNKFIIETADPELSLIKNSENANLLDFYRNELDLRKKLKYPPFSTMILISWPKSLDLKNKIESALASYDPVFFTGLSSLKKPEERCLLRLSPSDWPSVELREKLLSLPVSCSVEIAPDRIFS